MVKYSERDPGIRAKLDKLAKAYGYSAETLPTFSNPKDFSFACQEYSRKTHYGLELVDTISALSKASAYTRIYRY